MPPLDRLLLQVVLASRVGPTEIAVFSVVEPDGLELVGHMRNDQSDEHVRQQAVEAFKEIATPFLTHRRSMAVEVGPPTPTEPDAQFCLGVPYRARIDQMLNLLCFIIRRPTPEKAAAAIESMRAALQRAGLQPK